MGINWPPEYPLWIRGNGTLQDCSRVRDGHPVTANKEWQLLLRNGVIAIGTVSSSLINSYTMLLLSRMDLQMAQENIDVTK